MEKATFSIPTISCNHCIMTIQRELQEIEGIGNIEGNPDKKEITIEWEIPATVDKIKETLKEINYPAAE